MNTTAAASIMVATVKGNKIHKGTRQNEGGWGCVLPTCDTKGTFLEVNFPGAKVNCTKCLTA